jgi:hypothetical protein
VILSPGSFARVGLLVLLAVILEVSALSQIGILGGHADLVVLTVAAVAYYGGSVPGAATGFAAGFLLDLLTGATMGASSLVLTAVLVRFNRTGRARELLLRTALSEVRTLEGLIPICIHCKKVRDDQGFWEGVESYISSRSEARFSHGICADCGPARAVV